MQKKLGSGLSVFFPIRVNWLLFWLGNVKKVAKVLLSINLRALRLDRYTALD